MRLHVCFYLKGEEVINLNDVVEIEYIKKAHFLVVTTDIIQYIIHDSKFDKIEVDYI